ncbi:hypothetical protein H0H81_012622 [Sphagnurus paluster]|uniref:Uncharacterized protein n=1 Tax=Sphagnurus paluster TaxID=117069 RepID=A0A9P7KJ22_9AGAR|nr:hypothetical protein H0H81_012622 [Sphagnurus paluster]
METLPQPPRRFFGDVASLKSYNGNGSSSNAPSLKTSSLKTRKTMVLNMPSLLGRRRWSQSGDAPKELARGGIKTKDSNVSPLKPLPNQKSDMKPKSPDAPQRTTRSKTIIHFISTKFRTRSPSTSRSPRSPTQPTSGFGSRETREAALRERGLLPPLRPNADLSRAEREQDRRIPVLPTPSSDEIIAVDGEARAVSAASKVKQEWESKNKNATSMNEQSQLERMKTFKFGALSASPIPNAEDTTQFSTALVTVEEVDTPLPSPGLPPRSPIPNASGSASPKPASLRSKRSSSACGPELTISNEPASSTRQTPSPVDPLLLPLPPSPLPSPRIPQTFLHTAHDPDDIFAASIPLPPSPHPSLRPNTPQSQSTQSPPSLFAPAPIWFDQKDAKNTSLLCADLGPAFDVASQAMSDSTLSTSESASSFGPRPRPGALTVKVPQEKIPAIIESPVEDLSMSFLGPNFSRDTPTIEVALAHDSDDTTTTADVEAEPLDIPRGRNFTAPPMSVGLQAPQPERRKSLNPFKRSQTLSPDPSGGSRNSRRLSMSASLNNMRRSVVGTLTRPSKSPTRPKSERQKTFDASHLPPSPTIPNTFVDRAASRSPPMSPTSPRWGRFTQGSPLPAPDFTPRLAVAPMVYSRGSILIETNNIEDEETRRMTELAFLG